MRLTTTQIAIIRDGVSQLAGNTARVWLFGSRVRDDARGGDIGLLLETGCAGVACHVGPQSGFGHAVKDIYDCVFADAKNKCDFVLGLNWMQAPKWWCDEPRSIFSAAWRVA